MGRALGTLFAFPLLLIVLSGMFSGTQPRRGALLNVVVFPPLVAAVIALHEAGHALAGRLLGFSVPRVQIGMGRLVRRWRHGGTTIQLHAFPFGGGTHLGAHREAGLRMRLWLAVAAGPLATLAMVAILCLLPPRLTMKEAALPLRMVATTLAPRELLVVFGVLGLFLNLFPSSLIRRGTVENDGTTLLLLPFRSADRLREALIVEPVLEAEELCERRELDKAQRVLEAALGRVPGSQAVRNSLAVLALERGQMREARALFLELLAHDPLGPAYRWVLRNNLAWTDFRIRDPELQAEANEHSAAVAARLKNVPWALGTRGAVLVWLGRCKEALPLLEQAHALHDQPRNLALVASCLSWAQAALGRRDEAQRWLDRARASDPDCPLLTDAEAALSDAQPRRS